MTLQELRFIVTLAREKHFGKASAACFVSQPTLSVAVKKLEDSLGVIYTVDPYILPPLIKELHQFANDCCQSRYLSI